MPIKVHYIARPRTSDTETRCRNTQGQAGGLENRQRLRRRAALFGLNRSIAIYMPTSAPRYLPTAAVNAAFAVYRAVFIRLAWLFDLVLPLFFSSSPSPPLEPDSEGIVYSLNTGRGLPKEPARHRHCFVSRLGVLGDAQVQPYVRPWGGHGGEKKAVMLWSLEVIQQIAGEGHPNCKPGRCGEQITVQGVDWSLVKTGARIQLGEHVLLEATYLKGPCHQQEPNFTEGVTGGIQRISADRHPDDSRIHTRVIRTGHVAIGDKVRVWRSPRAISGVVVRCSSDPGNFISKEYDS